MLKFGPALYHGDDVIHTTFNMGKALARVGRGDSPVDGILGMTP